MIDSALVVERAESITAGCGCVPLTWKQAGAYKLLKSGRSSVLLVSMATTLGTSALMTDDLEPQHEVMVRRMLIIIK